MSIVPAPTSQHIRIVPGNGQNEDLYSPERHNNIIGLRSFCYSKESVIHFVS